MPSSRRTYADPCGIARALDLVGERWALLVVRELLLGPKRFSQLKRGLHEASPNVLVQRLRQLEDAGLVRRYRLGPPAGALVYELTERGYALERVLLALGDWGSRTPMTPMTRDAQLGVDALMIALKTRFDPQRGGDLRASYAVRLGEDNFRIEVREGRLEVARGSVAVPTATIDADPGTFRSVLFGRQPPGEAIQAGRLAVAGDQQAVMRLIALFADSLASSNQGRADTEASGV